jgi:hypothetical protein
VNGGQRCTTRPGGVVTEDGYQGRVAPEFLAFMLGLIDGHRARGARAPQPGSFGSGGTARRAPAHVPRPRQAGGRPFPRKHWSCLARWRAAIDERVFEDGCPPKR